MYRHLRPSNVIRSTRRSRPKNGTRQNAKTKLYSWYTPWAI